MCPPEHFTVEYAINPWMEAGIPVDAELALKQWTGLREALTAAGHTVDVLPADPGLPDMVFAANGAFSVDGRVYGARFRYPQRAAEAGLHRHYYDSHGWTYIEPEHVNEGEGDFAYVPGVLGGLILAGHGFRTTIAAHLEAQEALGHAVVSLTLVDPRFYHLDTCLAALDDTNVAYYPGAFSAGAQQVLSKLFPDAVLADEADALAFALNLVSDGGNVFLNTDSVAFANKLSSAGYQPVLIDLGELKKGGGSVKCCIAELRPATA
jgi:N-dimethylarginine dimethylaminohydrolase